MDNIEVLIVIDEMSTLLRLKDDSTYLYQMDYPPLLPFHSKQEELSSTIKLLGRRIRKIDFISQQKLIYIALPGWLDQITEKFIRLSFKKVFADHDLVFFDKGLLIANYFDSSSILLLEAGIWTGGLCLLEKNVVNSFGNDDVNIASILDGLNKSNNINSALDSDIYTSSAMGQKETVEAKMKKASEISQIQKRKWLRSNEIDNVTAELKDNKNKHIYSLSNLIDNFRLSSKLDYRPIFFNSTACFSNILFRAFREAAAGRDLVAKPTALATLFDSNLDYAQFKEMVYSSVELRDEKGPFHKKIKEFNDIFIQRDKTALNLLRDELRQFLPYVRKIYRQVQTANIMEDRLKLVLCGRLFDCNIQYCKILAKEIRMQFGACDIYYADSNEKFIEI